MYIYNITEYTDFVRKKKPPITEAMENIIKTTITKE